MSSELDCPESRDVTDAHQDLVTEATLPTRVAGRALTTWSLNGECWINVVYGGTLESLLAAETGTTVRPGDIDLANLGYGVAGRSRVAEDPPYFVFAARRPYDDDEIMLTALLLFGGAGSRQDLAALTNLDNYERMVIADHEVFVGSINMLDQGVHQRGSPYLYQNDEFMFLVVTDDGSWAEDAIGQLPK